MGSSKPLKNDRRIQSDNSRGQIWARIYGVTTIPDMLGKPPMCGGELAKTSKRLVSLHLFLDEQPSLGIASALSFNSSIDKGKKECNNMVTLP